MDGDRAVDDALRSLELSPLVPRLRSTSDVLLVVCTDGHESQRRQLGGRPHGK